MNTAKPSGQVVRFGSTLEQHRISGDWFRIPGLVENIYPYSVDQLFVSFEK